MRRRRQGDVVENGITTASAVATFVAGPARVARKPRPGRKRKKKSNRPKVDFRIPKEAAADALFAMLDEALPEPGAELVLGEKVGHSRTGGKGALRAWFGLFVGKRAGKKRKGAASGTFRGKGKYARRKYRLTKLGGGRYRLKRTA